MVQKYPAKKKLWGSKVDEIAFLLVITVHVYFEGMNRQEGVEIKAWEWLQQNRNTKIGRKACSEVFVNLYVTDYKEIYR